MYNFLLLLRTTMKRPLPQSYFKPSKLIHKLRDPILLCLFLLVVSLDVIESGSIVKTLPGFPGDLPFTLETGYIGVGKSDDVQLFYYFFESEGNPKNDPLMLRLTGGPGASVLIAIMQEIGPFTINNANSTVERQTLELKPYSWTKAANIIFVDQPAGTGFSYARTSEAYITNDTLATMHAYQFLRKWLVEHPKFLNNPFYVAGDSYSGILVPMIVQKIFNDNEVGERPYINIKGYVLGNPAAYRHDEYNVRTRYAHSMALLSDTIYKSTKENCHGEYVNVDPNNTLCINDLQVVDKCLARIQVEHILEPFCNPSPVRRDLKSIDYGSMQIWSLPQVPKQGCRHDNYLSMPLWANRREVREALHIPEDLNDIEWVIANDSLLFYLNRKPISFTHNIWSTLAYHRHLLDKKCQVLVYSGDHDMRVPYMSTLNWIKALYLLLVDDWRPWFVDEQVAGYTMEYLKDQYKMTFATIKGGGHTAPEYKPKECFNMFRRWLDNESL